MEHAYIIIVSLLTDLNNMHIVVVFRLKKYAHICMHARTCTHRHTDTCTQTHRHTDTHTHAHAHTHTHTHTTRNQSTHS